MNDSRSIYFNGGFRSESEPLFTGNARSVMYGDGCFETFRSCGGRYFRLGDHMRRLQEGLKYLGIPVPGVLTRGPEFLSLLDQLLERNDMQDRDALVRIQVSRRGSRGYRTGDSEGAHLVIASYPAKNDYDPIALATAGIRRIPAASMPPQFKFTNGINYILAASEAVKKGADDALMLTIDGSVSETTIANIFWQKGDTVYTPGRGCDLLPGITRKAVIRMLEKQMKVEVVEGAYGPEEIKNADCVWVCNSVRELVAVRSIDGREYPAEHPFFTDLVDQFRSYRNKNLGGYE